MTLLLKINSLVMAMMALSMAILLFLVKCPPHKALRKYNLSRKIMAFVFFSIAIVKLFHLIYLLPTTSTSLLSHSEIISGLYIIVASWQALLVTYSLIVLIDLDFVTKRRVFEQIIPVTILSILIVTALFTNSIQFFNGMIIVFSIYYLFQLIFYTYLYFSREKKVRLKADNYFSDDEIRHIRWTRTAFVSLLCVGIWAFIVVLFPEKILIERLFSFVAIIFYLCFGISYLNYVLTFYVLMPILVAENEETERMDFSTSEMEAYNNLDGKLKQWIDTKSFSESGITINKLAEQLNTNRTYLSNYINSKENMNFNRWLNTLRVEESKSLMLENPDIKFSELVNLVGFKEQSNFSKQFTKIVGQTPSRWKDENIV